MKLRIAAPLLLTLAFILATRLDGWAAAWAGRGQRGGSMLAMMMGESRRLFANQFFVKADVYFHSGYYPTIFDNQAAFDKPHIAANAGDAEEPAAGEATDALGEPLDWIDRFSRRFYPSVHTHLEQGGPRAMAGGAPVEGSGRLVREMLPWLRMSVALDPQRLESYVVAAYWLREKLDAPGEAEGFLREGLRANPDSHELLFELGLMALESRGDNRRAQTLWRSGIAKWQTVEATKAEPDYFDLRRLLAYLALAEERNGQYLDALAHLREADALPGGQGLYQQRLQRAQDLLEGKQPAISEAEAAPAVDEHACHDPNCHLDHAH